MDNGRAIFGEYKAVRFGVIKTNEIGTNFPDATKQP